MKKIFLCIEVLLFFTCLTSASSEELGKISTIDSGKKEITVSIKSGINLKMGDLLEVHTEDGNIIFDVVFPMMTTSKCKIKGKGKLSALSKGMVVYRFNKVEDKVKEEIIGKKGEIKKFGDIEFVSIPGGTFKMGSNIGEVMFLHVDNDSPIHKVTVDSFYMSKFLVTQKTYSEIMGTNPSHFKSDDNLPVESVNWDDAMEFCKKFSDKYNVKARLPYEAEWEYACRAGTISEYYWGNEMNGDYCWNGENSNNQTHPVGGKKPNVFGLYDMSGNVWELCVDWFSKDYYKISPKKNPTGPSTGHEKVARGGCYYYDLLGLSSSSRMGLKPDERSEVVGFRIVVTP